MEELYCDASKYLWRLLGFYYLSHGRCPARKVSIAMVETQTLTIT